MPSAAIVAAHPDDEVIGASAIIAGLPHSTVLFVTDGAPRNPFYAWHAGFATREEYAGARRREAAAALAIAGLGEDRILHLRFPDQESSFQLVELTRKLADILRRGILQPVPDLIVTHAYEGGHPDHDATAFAVHAAKRILERNGGKAPELIEFTSYFERCGEVVVSDFLPNDLVPPPRALLLTNGERQRKRRMIDCYASRRTLRNGFPTDRELYRAAPPYRFTAAPHPGRLHYEHFDWNVTGNRWRSLAREALQKLQILEPL